MSLATGDKFGSYEILALIGKGGMGEVYRARDSKLKRDVAVKVLPEVFACDSGRMDRFEREAEVLASLNHQNIAHIYGVEDRALIMELAEGESPRGPLPFDEAWKIASQIADALAYAHEKGVVHRDLKPANIKVAPDGTVKLLDFGLAKAFTGTPDSASAEPANSPTLTMGATVAGVILGTAGYMSPEQARGKSVDRRADIWAFGVVLYELLTGKRLFQGEDLTDTLASVVKVQPDLNPAPVEACRLLQACLEKDPKKRLQAIGDARYLIGDAAPVEHRRKGTVTAWIAAGAVAVALGVALWASWRAAAPAAGIVRLTMETSPAERLGPMSRGRPAAGSMALSPDGNTLVFAGETQTGQNQKTQRLLYKRSLDQSAATPIAGTDDAYAPFFSPDGEWVGFFTGGLAIGGSSTLKKIPMAGGPATVICDLPETPSVRGASWGTADQIVFAGRDRGLLQVPASGGTPQRLFKTDPANSSFDVSPWFLPDGKTLLFTKRRSDDWREAQIMARRVDTGEQHALVKGGADPRYVRTGHLLYLVNGVLMAVPFDAQNAQVSGKPVALIDGVMQSVNMTNGGLESGIGQVAISPSGNLVYALGGIFPGVPATIVRMDRKGVQTELGAPKGLYVGLRVSPDGQRLGSFRGADNSRQRDIWVLDMNTGNATRLTSDGSSSNAVWSADGKRLFYRAGDGGRQIRSIAADGSGAPETILTGEGVWPAQATPSLLVYLAGGLEMGMGIWTRPISRSGEARRFTEFKFNMLDAALSPDGHWMTYSASDSGANEIWVQAFPAGERHRISTNDGINPAWSPNGRELFFLAREGIVVSLMAVDFTPGTEFKAGVPHRLFDGPFYITMPQRSWDVTPDGQHFIMVRRDQRPDEIVSKLNVVLNWGEELKKRAPRSGR